MRRANRLSFMMRRGQSLHLRTTVAAPLPPLSQVERELVARLLAQEQQGRAFVDSENEWEYEEEGECSEEELEPPVEDDSDADQQYDDGAAVWGEVDPAGDGASPSADENDENDYRAAAQEEPSCGEGGAAAADDQQEAGQESSDTGAPGVAGSTAAAAAAPCAPPLQLAGEEVAALLKHLLMGAAESSFSLAGLEESADCTLEAVNGLRQEMDARFASLEKTLFFIMKQLAVKKPPPTQRRIGYSSGPKAAPLAKSGDSTDTGIVAAALAASAAATAASRPARR